MRIVFMGTPDFAVPTLDALYECGYDIPLVVTKPDAAVGRGKKIRFSPVKERALSLGLSLLQPDTLKDNKEAVEQICNATPDYIVAVAYGKLLPPDILALARGECLNVHGSLLPRHRGAAPIQWSILAGDEEGGVSVMRMEEGMDTGAVFAKEALPIDGRNAEQLGWELATRGARLLCQTIEKIENGTADPVPQEEALATYAPMIRKEDGHLDFARPAAELERRVRGLYAWPGTFAYLDGEPFKIWQADVLKEPSAAAPGTVLSATEGGIAIACGEGALLAQEIQVPGKKRMAAAAYLKGHSIEKGTVLR